MTTLITEFLWPSRTSRPFRFARARSNRRRRDPRSPCHLAVTTVSSLPTQQHTARRASVFENGKYSADKCSHEPPLLKIDGIGRKSPSGRLLFLYWPRKKLIIGPLVVCPIVSHSVTQLPNAVELPRGSRLGHGTRVVVKWTGNECHGIFWLTNSFSDNFHCYLLSRPPGLAVPCFLSCACYTQICQ